MADLEQRTRRALDEIEAQGLTRTLRRPAGIDLSSNDYLGLADHPLLRAAMAQAVLHEGVGSTGSRLLRGERAGFAQIERRFAAWKGAEASLYFSSGYGANLGVLSTFLEEGDVVFSDEFNHASLIDGMRLGRARRVIFPHCDVTALRSLLRAEPGEGQRFLVTESLFSMDGDIAPLEEYAELCRETDTRLIVDEAHAVGLFGERGSGLIERSGIDADVFLSVNTAGKALGVSGAFVAGPRWAIDFLVQRARTFVFSTAPPPSVAAAIDAALNVIAAEPEPRAKTLAFARRLRTLLSEAGIRVPPGESQIIPILLGDNERAVQVATALQQEGFDVRAIRPPTVPEGTARLRISVNAKLHEADLDAFVTLIVAALAEKVACGAASS
ncbi:MAG TPA: 8-amino-7-oxononanoate synthase [Bryobacterales bacterium]|nr:8-amino-7-oxononanoate synthase [Bryobacterales bacterium]